LAKILAFAIAKGKADLAHCGQPMDTKKEDALRWIEVRLGDDMNWWLDKTSGELTEEAAARGVLDPRQVAHLVETLVPYHRHGCRRQELAGAFQMFALESALSEGSLRLAATDEDITDTGAQLFALPVIDGDGGGPYYEFLDALSEARIRQINATHHYAQDCTVEEMQDELSALDADRYFSAESIHAFDEISEILQWSPAEWDESAEQ
jgi:hypothetical protein